MRLSLERTSIILVGSWNHAIFSSEWVARTLFPGGAVVSMVGMLPSGGAAVQCNADGVHLEALPGRLQLRFGAVPVDCGRLEKLARDCLTQLPETPVEAFGINAGFDVDEPADNLSRILSFDDDARLGAFGALTRSVVVRDLQQDATTRLRLTLSRGESGINLDLNKHRDVKSNARAAAALFSEGAVQATITEFRRLALEVYGLTGDE